MNAAGTSKWPMVALGEIVCPISTWNPRREVPNEEIIYVDLSAVSRETKEIVEPNRILGAEAPSRARQLIEAKDVLVSTVRPNLNAVAQVSTEMHGSTASTGFTVLRPDSKRLSDRYLAHWVKAPFFIDYMVRNATGASYPAVSDNIVKSSKIPLPPLEEQKRIAAILDKADALRRKRRDALALLDTLTQSIFVEMFGDPASNPQGWPIVKLGSIGELDRGKSKHRPRNDPALLGGDHPLIQTGDVAASGGRIKSFTSTYSDIGLKQSKKWPKGTLCITIAANIADTGILEFDACFPDSVVAFSHSDEFMTEYVQVWLSFLKKNLDEMAPQAAQKNINLKILRDLEMPLPERKMLMRFAASLKTLHWNHDQQILAQKRSEGLFAALQSHAFSGEL